MIAAADLARLDLFAEVPAAALAHVASGLEQLDVSAGEVLMHQGDTDQRFVVVIDGSLEVVRGSGDGMVRLAVSGPGSILGELALLRHQPRVATVAALTAARVGVGDRDTFAELLELPGVHHRIADVTARRMAELIVPLHVTLSSGTRVEVRPLLRADRNQYAGEVRGLLPESRRRRFFSSGVPSEKMFDYLVNIDYIDHFAWVVATPDHQGLATARYVRDNDHHDHADIAFGVIDQCHGQGIGTFLLGALGAAASSAGITTFTADVLDDNIPMRKVFDKAGAEWRRSDPGVVHATMAVDATCRLLPQDQLQALASAATDVVTAAGAALTSPPA